MKDIEILEEFAKEYKDTGYFGIIKAEQIQILDNILKERQADKEKIKELEAINKRLRYTMNNAYLLDYIPRKVIEDKIEEENKQFDYFNNKNDEYGMLVYYVRKKVLQELLKDGGE